MNTFLETATKHIFFHVIWQWLVCIVNYSKFIGRHSVNDLNKAQALWLLDLALLQLKPKLEVCQRFIKLVLEFPHKCKTFIWQFRCISFKPPVHFSTPTPTHKFNENHNYWSAQSPYNQSQYFKIERSASYLA